MIEQDLVAFLNGQTAVTAIVGANIFATHLPQGASKPALSIQWISRTPGYHLDGEDGVCKARVQLDCWAYSISAVAELSEALRNCLSGFTGALESTHVRVALWDNMVDLDEPPVDNSDSWLYHRAVDFLIYFDQAKATP